MRPFCDVVDSTATGEGDPIGATAKGDPPRAVGAGVSLVAVGGAVIGLDESFPVVHPIREHNKRTAMACKSDCRKLVTSISRKGRRPNNMRAFLYPMISRATRSG